MKRYLMFGILTVFVFLAIPITAAENAKIKLPDGLYMYDSSIRQLQKGGIWVGFGKYLVVKNNTIYSSQGAIKKFGISKFNKLFTENKKYKILFGGEQIGEIYDVNVREKGRKHLFFKEDLITENIKEGPAYKVESIYINRMGSAVRAIAVPEEYKEVKKKVYTTIPQEEVDKVSKLVKEQLYPLVKNKLCKILDEERLELLDKASDHNGELYIGIYRFVFKRADGHNWIYCDNKMIFSIKNQNVNFITSRQDADWMTICGMLDVDGDGEDELIIERTFGGEDGSTTTMEIYKQKADGNWTRIKK